MTEPIHVNTAAFERAVVQSPVPVVVDFWAPWCGPCRALGPVLDEIAKETGDRFRVVKINVDEEPDLASRYGIRSIPALLYFSGGELKTQTAGVVGKKVIVDRLESLVSTSV